MGSFNKQKAFGQHFLTEAGIIQGIVQATLQTSRKYPKHSILEIGPGKGAITRTLLSTLPIDTPFFLAERDRDLIELWAGESRVKKILKGDFLNQTDEELAELGNFLVVSNLPYSAGTAIVVKLALMKQVPEMILMFQAEVAKRLYAEASTPDRGSLSLFIQNEWEVEKLMRVDPKAFNPPPKVMSEVVRLKRRETPLIPLHSQEERDEFDDLLKQSFKHRRKMLKGNLAGTKWQKGLELGGVNPSLRAEALEWEDWIKIWTHART
ncbi:MAG: rRNA ((1518)-N(6)/adenine(1519)-N(6))-dimethyltransferase RsmA [Chthonomonadaceae bacterium]|nr:rRNA ((1518)-N(6)/adenine(1519)-N(6))-dimethyltransferase RsmA [Chthonomonadaceae bacterium]